jgi:hypothetical protein
MARAKSHTESTSNGSAANLGFEAKLWLIVAIERDNPQLKGILPKDFGRPALDKHRLGELIDVIGTIGLGDAENRSKDILGRVYEYFLTQFASAEGRTAGSSTRRAAWSAPGGSAAAKSVEPRFLLAASGEWSQPRKRTFGVRGGRSPRTCRTVNSETVGCDR